ncbi:MAG: hypothetical protein LBP41_02315 [Holosporaceae bacterium]|jgi:hypothetical protein|nr:hypothetical protein [Holosporaceae bacterium]
MERKSGIELCCLPATRRRLTAGGGYVPIDALNSRRNPKITLQIKNDRQLTETQVSLQRRSFHKKIKINADEFPSQTAEVFATLVK